MKKNLRVIANMVTMILVAILVGGCPDKNLTGPDNPMTLTASITCNGKVGACEVDFNSTATIAWTSANVSSCDVKRDGVSVGWTGLAGTNNTPILTANTVYSLECTGPNGPATASVSITVKPPVEVELTFTSRLTGQPVASATVTVLEKSYTTNGQGVAKVLVPASTTSFKISATGFLPRVDTYTGATNSFTMFQCYDSNCETQVKQMLYGDSSAFGNHGLRGLWHLKYPSVLEILSDEMAVDSMIVVIHQQAALIIQNGMGGLVSISIGTGTSNFVPVAYSIDPTALGVGQTTRTVILNLIQSAKVQYHDRSGAINLFVVAHELGHVIGLGHHVFTGLMGSNLGGVAIDFSPAEKAYILQALRTEPGNTYPDTAPARPLAFR